VVLAGGFGRESGVLLEGSMMGIARVEEKIGDELRDAREPRGGEGGKGGREETTLDKVR